MYAADVIFSCQCVRLPMCLWFTPALYPNECYTHSHCEDEGVMCLNVGPCCSAQFVKSC